MYARNSVSRRRVPPIASIMLMKEFTMFGNNCLAAFCPSTLKASLSMCNSLSVSHSSPTALNIFGTPRWSFRDRSKKFKRRNPLPPTRLRTSTRSSVVFRFVSRCVTSSMSLSSCVGTVSTTKSSEVVSETTRTFAPLICSESPRLVPSSSAALSSSSSLFPVTSTLMSMFGVGSPSHPRAAIVSASATKCLGRSFSPYRAVSNSPSSMTSEVSRGLAFSTSMTAHLVISAQPDASK